MEKSAAADARQLREMLMRSPVFTSGVVTIASAIGAVFIWARPGTKKIRRTLRKRILEELKDERAFVWRYIYDETEVGLRLAKIGYEGQKVVELKYNALSKF